MYRTFTTSSSMSIGKYLDVFTQASSDPPLVHWWHKEMLPTMVDIMFKVYTSHTAVLKQAGAIVLKIAQISLKVNVPGYGKSLRTKSSKTTVSIISCSGPQPVHFCHAIRYKRRRGQWKQQNATTDCMNQSPSPSASSAPPPYSAPQPVNFYHAIE